MVEVSLGTGDDTLVFGKSVHDTNIETLKIPNRMEILLISASSIIIYPGYK